MVENLTLLRGCLISKIRLYHPDSIESSIKLSANQVHYLTKVMRIKKEDPFYLFNKVDGEWMILGDEKKQVRHSFEMPFLALAFSPLAKHDRMRFLIEKATEMGVTHFIPVKTRYTQGRFDEKKAQSWAIEASEQCERLSIPFFEPLCDMKDIFKKDIQWSVALEREEGNSFEAFSNGLLIGPEGGFSQDEKTFLKKQKAKILNLGPYILRAETAALVGLCKII